MRIHIIACRVLTRELSYFASQSPHTVDITWLPQGLHDTPAKLRMKVSETIDSLYEQWEKRELKHMLDVIVLGYGLCSNGVVGIQARDIPLVVPRTDDCIALFLGSQQRYLELFHAYAGTFWLNSGWVETAFIPTQKLLEQKKQLDEQAAQPDFWNDVENTKKVLKEQKTVNEKVGSYENLVRMYEDAQTMLELAAEEEFDSEEEQESFLQDIRSSLKEIAQRIEEEKLSALLSGEFDQNNAILSFHAGAGGTEAQDWVQMLYRMYARWSERHHFKVKVLDYLAGEEAGIKSASILITGTNAYGFLKSEHGVHRLVRISPFDASGRRQTSFASLEVMPEIDDDYDIEINPADLKIDTYRSGGAGGQHVNKTESAIRITHIPTGVIVACQNERSQHQNREVAMKMLKSKLVKIKEREHLKRIEDIKGEQQQIGWGSQIRSYVFMPYTLVKDHRTNCESGNINAVMDGDLDPFINAYLKAASQGEI